MINKIDTKVKSAVISSELNLRIQAGLNLILLLQRLSNLHYMQHVASTRSLLCLFDKI